LFPYFHFLWLDRFYITYPEIGHISLFLPLFCYILCQYLLRLLCFTLKVFLEVGNYLKYRSVCIVTCTLWLASEATREAPW
jgi:hypothetical protein